MALTAMMTRRLNTADPTIVPMPMLDLNTNVSMKDVISSGADEPAAMNVAPATSSLRFSRLQITSREGTLEEEGGSVCVCV